MNLYESIEKKEIDFYNNLDVKEKKQFDERFPYYRKRVYYENIDNEKKNKNKLTLGGKGKKYEKIRRIILSAKSFYNIWKERKKECRNIVYIPDLSHVYYGQKGKARSKYTDRLLSNLRSKDFFILQVGNEYLADLVQSGRIVNIYILLVAAKLTARFLNIRCAFTKNKFEKKVIREFNLSSSVKDLVRIKDEDKYTGYFVDKLIKKITNKGTVYHFNNGRLYGVLYHLNKSKYDTFEIQHGAISKYDTYYSYPDSLSEVYNKYFPKRIGLFGIKWKEAYSTYSKAEIVGDYLETLSKLQIAGQKKIDKIIFVSSTFTHEKCAKEFFIKYEKFLNGYNVFYKIRPGEEICQKFRKFLKTRNIIELNEVPKEGFSYNDAIYVGINSTMLLEKALEGCNVYLLKCKKYYEIEYINNLENVQLIKTNGNGSIKIDVNAYIDIETLKKRRNEYYCKEIKI